METSIMNRTCAYELALSVIREASNEGIKFSCSKDEILNFLHDGIDVYGVSNELKKFVIRDKETDMGCKGKGRKPPKK